MKDKVRKVINASGKMSILGTSTVSDAVSRAMQYGAQNFFVMDEYLKQLEAEIANALGYPHSKIVASAASGVVSAVCGVIGRDNPDYSLNPYTYNTDKREIVIPKGHNVNFGAPIETLIEMGGGVIVEAGYSNECSKAQVMSKITENTSALLYIKSHHCVQKNMLSIEDMVSISKAYDLPIIVDAAAEEDFTIYKEMGIDLLIFSGSKAIEGPSSGIILGNKKSIAWTKHVDKGIGRAMKVSKEMASGLYEAILNRDQDKKRVRLDPYVMELNASKLCEASIAKDPAGRDIVRLEIKTSPQKSKYLIEKLEAGDPAIYTRNYKSNQGILEIDTRAIDKDELTLIVERIKELLYE